MLSTVTFLLAVFISGSHQQCFSPNDNVVTTNKGKSNSWIANRHDFGLSVFRSLNRELSKDNIVISPSIIHDALLLAYFGSAGETEKTLAKLLKISSSVEKSEAWRFYKTERQRQSPGMKIANKIYVSPKIKLRPCIQENLLAEIEVIQYGEGLWPVNYINEWVSEVTGGEIKDAVYKLSSNSTANIVSVASFQSKWGKGFNPKFTKKYAFYWNTGKSQVTNMMVNHAYLASDHSDSFKARWVALPYYASKAMILLLPDDDLDSTIASLNSNDIQIIANISRYRNSQSVEVRIPKFKHKNKLSLNSVLGYIGLGDVLSGSADFSRFTGRKDVTFGSVLHDAVISVDEQGTEAESSLGVAQPNSASAAGPLRIALDHPFAYFIYDYDNNEIEFIGTFREPN